MTAPGGTSSDPPASTTPTRPNSMKRYGPIIAIVAVIAVVAVVAVVAGRGSSDSSSTASGPTGTNPGAAGVSNLAAVPMTYDEAKAQGKETATTWADDCDTTTAKIKMPSVYAPPCLPKFAGDNGGATSPGVTKDEITIVNYVASTNGDLNSLLAGQIDTPEATLATGTAYINMLSDLFQTYGRKINFVNFNSQGAADDATAAQADAVSIAEKYHPFASINGPALTPAYAEELARRKIICIGCGGALPDQFYQDHQPYIWGAQPSAEEFLVNVGDFVSKDLLGHKAVNAGDPDLQAKDRVFGTVNFEQDPPVFTSINDALAKCGNTAGYQAADTETYLFDIAKMPERATTIVAKMKDAGVTTILFLGDPIMPIYLTQAAEAQNYHPEWIVTGTALTDTTTLGRFYNPDQWKHAFGLSNLAARTNQDQQEAYRLHQWYYGQKPVAAGTSGVIYPPLSQILTGIYMAGPNLTPETFKAGLFHLPEAGGGPTTPHVSYGDHGYFKELNPDTCKQGQPRPDYLGIDDVTQIWWDATATGPDEQGKSDKPGMYRYVDMGKRYLPGQLPAGEPKAFDPTNTITIYDTVPAADQPPSYPSPNKPLPPAPAAGT
jgi:hypothetical protein